MNDIPISEESLRRIAAMNGVHLSAQVALQDAETRRSLGYSVRFFLGDREVIVDQYKEVTE
jgi:hypothetical protein